MNEPDYIKAVRDCTRTYWMESGISLKTMKRNSPKLVSGFIVRKIGKSKVSLVADFVLADKYAVRRLAMNSTPRKLTGWLVRPISDLI
jgi:hypothetical protein